MLQEDAIEVAGVSHKEAEFRDLRLDAPVDLDSAGDVVVVEKTFIGAVAGVNLAHGPDGALEVCQEGDLIYSNNKCIKKALNIEFFLGEHLLSLSGHMPLVVPCEVGPANLLQLGIGKHVV